MEEDARSALRMRFEAGKTPIAELSPQLRDQPSLIVRGVITIIWPFSSATKSIAVLLAELDFRLRRSGGQVRVQFTGSAAKAFRDLELGAGDEVAIVLEGAQWTDAETIDRVPGQSLRWQLKFSERLVLQVARATFSRRMAADPVYRLSQKKQEKRST
jgi:hypothetical protein